MNIADVFDGWFTKNYFKDDHKIVLGSFRQGKTNKKSTKKSWDKKILKTFNTYTLKRCIPRSKFWMCSEKELAKELLLWCRL